MTDVGRIKLSVEIDANNLSEKLGEAVRKAIAPALAEIQAELQKVQREYDKTEERAEKSDAAQVAGAKAVESAIKGVRDAEVEAAVASDRSSQSRRASNDALSSSTRKVTDAQNQLNTAIDIFGRKSPQAEAAQKRLNSAQEAHTTSLIKAAAESRASTDSQIEDYERLARAAEESAAKQQIANKVGSEGRGGRHGILGFLTGPTGLNTIALGANAIAPALTGIVALTGAVQQLGQAGLVLPAIYAAAGASVGVAFLGVHGMKDAITALNKAAAPDATPADLKKVTDSLKDMDPAAVATAKSISALMQGPLKDLEKSVQGKMFAGFSGEVDNFGKTVIPRVTGNIGKIADSWNGTLKQITGSVGGERNLSLIDRFLGNTAEGQKRANAAIEPLVHSFATLVSTGGEFLPRLGDALTKVANRFDSFVSDAGKTGKLWKWIDEGLNGLRALGDSILNIGKTITGLTASVGGDSGFLGWLEKATGRMQAFVNSTDGQGKLHDFFANGKEDLHAWGDLFKELLPALLKIIEGFAAWGQVTLPIITALSSLVNWLGQVPGLVQGIVVAFLAWRTIGGIIGGVGDKIKGLSSIVGGSGIGPGNSATKGGSALNKGLLGLGIAGAGTTVQQAGGTDLTSQILGGLATVGGSALTGASIGSVIPGVGTAVGAAVGAGIGSILAGVNAAIGENAEQAKAAAAANDKLAASMAATAQAYELTGAAVKTLNDSLLASKGVFDPAAIAAVGDEIGQIPDKLKSTLGDDAAKRVADALKGLGDTTTQLATIVTGSQADFDALTGRLRNMGDGGQEAAAQLQKVRDEAIGASQAAATAGPLLQTLADTMKVDIPQAAANLDNAFKALPTNVPIKVDMPGGQAVLDILKDLHQQVTTDDKKEIVVTAPLAPDVLAQLQKLGIEITQNNDKTISVSINQSSLDTTFSQLGQLGDYYKSLFSGPIPAPAPPAIPLPGTVGPGLPTPPKARGGIVGFASGGVYGQPGPTIPGQGINPPLPGDWGPGTIWGPKGSPGDDPQWLTQFPYPGWPGPPFVPGDPWRANRRGVTGFAGGGVPGGIGSFVNLTDNQVIYKGHIVNVPPDGNLAPIFSYIDQYQEWMSGPGIDYRIPAGAGRGDGRLSIGDDSGNATGGIASGVLPGYSPGLDNMMVPLSGGEGIVIPEAMRAMGPDWLYNLNSKFRPGISRAGYSMGGVFGYDEGGVPPPLDNSVTGLLTQIRDLLAGRGGASSNPMAQTAASTQKMASSLGAGGAGGAQGLKPGQTGDWGTDFANNFLAYFGIGPLGGTPLGGIRPGAAGYPGVGAAGAAGGGFNAGSFAGPLAAFARSGNLTPELAGMGLDANDPVIRAIVSARDRKKGGLGGDAIGDLVQQILSGGGYTGNLTPDNQSLISALETFQQRGGRQVGIPGAAGLAGGGGLGPAAFGGGNALGSSQALIQFAQAASGGKYGAASDLANGLADCSGAVSDLVELLTKGKTSPDRLFSTSNEASVLQSLGAVPGLVPGSLQIGLNSGHTAATLPNGVNFESGGSGGGVVYGGPVGAGDKQFTQTFSLPTDATGRAVGAGYGAGGMPQFSGSTPGLGGFNGGVVPVYVTNWGGGAGPGGAPGGAAGAGAPGVPGGSGGAAAAGLGNAAPGVAAIGSAGISALGGITSNVSADVLHATASTIVPGLFGKAGTPTAPDTDIEKLFKEGNPLAIAKAAGLTVPDYSRDGNQLANTPAAPGGYDASGRLFSDTSATSGRTQTDLAAQINAMRSQLVAVGNQTVTALSDKVLTPVLSAGVTSGFSAINDSVFNAQGTAIGTAAGPPIATAVAAAIPAGGSNDDGSGGATANNIGNALAGIGGGIGDAISMAGGGLVSGGTPGVDSVPVLAQQNEWMLNTDDVAKLGGVSGVARFIGGLRSGKLRMLAGGGVTGQGSAPSSANADATVGADFFGVSQIPIIGTIVNILIDILLKVIGVNIQVRDTLNNIGSDFRSFRGDFKEFDASGRLANDTSGLVDRSSTSEQTAADERIRILKIVLDALIKFIIDKIIVPLLEAVGQAAVSAAGSAVGAGISGASFGAGGAGGAAASSFINALGDAGIQIAGQVGTDIANAVVDVFSDQIAGGLQSLLPGLVSGLFGGGLIEGITGPIGTVLSTVLGGFMGVITVLLGGLGGGASTLIPGLPFDEGGLASGVGFLPKATMDDELVLSPRNTDIFTRFVNALQNGGFGKSSNNTVHAPITVMQAGPETATQVQDRLLRFMP